MTPEKYYPVIKSGTVWMTQNRQSISAARVIAEDVMTELGMDPNDWRTRDRIIATVSPTLTGMLNYVADCSTHSRGDDTARLDWMEANGFPEWRALGQPLRDRIDAARLVPHPKVS